MANNAEMGSLEIIELDERLEFSAVVIESDLDSDTNNACSNGTNCTATNTGTCTNYEGCS